LESQKQRLRETKLVRADRSAVAALRSCKHAAPALKKLTKDLNTSASVRTTGLVSKTAYRETGGWLSSGLLDRGCQGKGIRLLEELEDTSGLERQQTLVDICDVPGQFPVSENEIVDNFNLDLALQYLLIAGQVGEVGEDDWYGTVAEMVFTAEIPHTPYTEGDGTGDLSSGDDIPQELGGARLGEEASSYDLKAWRAPFASMRGTVRIHTSQGKVNRITFERFKVTHASGENAFKADQLTERLDQRLSDDVTRESPDAENVARVYRSGDRELRVLRPTSRQAKAASLGKLELVGVDGSGETAAPSGSTDTE
jgi:hypothetical protein